MNVEVVLALTMGHVLTQKIPTFVVVSLVIQEFIVKLTKLCAILLMRSNALTVELVKRGLVPLLLAYAEKVVLT